MGPRNTLNAFNRFVGNIKEPVPLINNPLNGVLFVDTQTKKALEVKSGAMSTAEVQALGFSTEIKAKIKASLEQRDANGNPILPAKLYVGGINLTGVDALQELEMLIKQTCVDNKAQSINIVFDKSDEVLKKVGFLESLDPILTSWDSWAWFEANDKTEIREPLKTTKRIGVIKSHTGENIADGALMGRVIYMGVGKADGVAKELYGVTADKLSIKADDGGDLTVTESIAWEDLNVNLYVQTVDMYNETTGMKLLSGLDFENRWELTKVAVDVRNDCVQFRHLNDRLGVSEIDEARILGIVNDRLQKLTVDKKNPEANPNGLIVDYKASIIELDRTLEDNVNKIAIKISVLQRGISKWFDLSLTGYIDKNQYNVEVGE